jgi:hypothetical protein
MACGILWDVVNNGEWRATPTAIGFPQKEAFEHELGFAGR